METVRYKILLRNLGWTELWNASGASALRFSIFSIVKLLGLDSVDPINELSFKVRPIGFEDLPVKARAEAHAIRASMEDRGFKFLFAECPTSAAEIYSVYCQNDEITAQVACRLGHRIQMTALITVLGSGAILVTCNDKPGINNGGLTKDLLARGKPFDQLLALHRSRYPSRDAKVLTGEQIILQLEETCRKAFQFNLQRCVYERIGG